MCWNEAVSLNTFAFSTFVLALIVYNNAYTRYKIESFQNPYMVLFAFSIISIQLVEAFIWRNVNDAFYNHVFSCAAAFLLLIQPALSLMLIRDATVRYRMVAAYLAMAVPYTVYQFIETNIRTVVSPAGHLLWKFFDNSPKPGILLVWAVWLLFFLFGFVYNGLVVGFCFSVVVLLIAAYNFYTDRTVGSLWCWLANSFMLLAAAYLLLWLPAAKG